MTTPAVQAPPAEASSAPPAEDDASRAVTPDTAIVGTPGDTAADPANVGTGETPATEEPVRELIHSEETLTAARAEAEAAGLDRGRRETAQQAQERRQAILMQYTEQAGDQPAAYLRRWQTRLNDLEVAPENQQEFIADGRNVFDQMVDAAYAVTGSSYQRALMGLLGDEANQKAFNDKLGGLDGADDVFKTYADFVALDQPSIAHAKPEELVSRNKALAAYIESKIDAASVTARAQGQADPRGRETTVDGRPAGGIPSWDAFNAMSEAEQLALTPETRRAIYEADRVRRARINA